MPKLTAHQFRYTGDMYKVNKYDSFSLYSEYPNKVPFKSMKHY